MINKCKVKLHNEKVAVIIFDDKEIQVPSSNLIGETAYVKFEKNKYEIISKSEYEKESSEKIKRKTGKDLVINKKYNDIKSDETLE